MKCMMNKRQTGFWKEKPLQKMTRKEWELLCDGCGRCCLEKLKDAKNGKVYYTNLACRYLDLKTCRCTIYAHRTRIAPDCEWLNPFKIARFRWLPKTCAYRLVMETKDLAWWHPLISGDPETVHLAGISVKNIAVSSLGVPEDEYEDYILDNNLWAKSARI